MSTNDINTGYEIGLWLMDAAEYKHVVLGLVFFKYTFNAFAKRYAILELEKDQRASEA